MVTGVRLTVITLPITPGARPKLRAQKPSLITATAPAPGTLVISRENHAAQCRFYLQLLIVVAGDKLQLTGLCLPIDSDVDVKIILEREDWLQNGCSASATAGTQDMKRC